MSRRRLLPVLLGLTVLAPAAGCGGREPGDAGADTAAPEAVAPGPAQPDEFSRRLHLAMDQMRRYLPASARAELDRAAALRPDDPELTFQRARLELFPDDDGRDEDAALALLERVVESDPDHLAARRLIYDLRLGRGERAAAAAQRAAIERDFGLPGAFEMLSHEACLRREPEPYLRFPEERAGSVDLDDYRNLRDALLRLERNGDYAPSEAVPVAERILAAWPGLTTVRYAYARKLIYGEVRVSYSDRPGLPPMSSTLIMDMAQLHLERVFDRIDPVSRLAVDVVFTLSHAALLMGDYDESVAHLDTLLGVPVLPDGYRRYLTGRRGLARYKQGRNAEAVELFHDALAGPSDALAGGRSLAWALHVAYEAAQTPQAERRRPFRFRPDLLRPSGSNPFAFVDDAPRLGIDKRDGLGPSAWGDYDGDGDFDLFVTGADSYGALYRNDGERFTDVSREAGLFHVHSGFSATFVDYDNDGDPDLHVGRDGWNGPMPNSLYRNEGDGTFRDVTAVAGLADPGSSFVCVWSDVDRDGDLDLMVANGITGDGHINRFYRNEGDGTFVDATVAAGLAEPPGLRTIGLAFGDYDLDGWPDLFVSGYFAPNRLYRNRGDGTFEEVAERAGVADAQDLTTGYVAFFLDFDNDLDLDILRPSLAPWDDVLVGLEQGFDALPPDERRRMLRHCTRLYRNDGDGSFTEIGAAAGFVHPVGTMGAGVADLDNDGYVDVYLGTGDPSIERLEPDRFYRNDGDGSFTDLTFVAGLGNIGKGHGITFVDLDGDGDLEMYAPEGGFVHGDPWPNALYVNRHETSNHWLHVDLVGHASNRDALDARVVVHAGGLRVLREVHAGEGFGSSNSPTVEIGLGAAERIDRMEVRWPSGTVQLFDDVPIDRRIVVHEGRPWKPRNPPDAAAALAKTGRSR